MRTLRKYIKVATLVMNIIAILALWLCCISTWLHPDKFPHLSLMGLLFPGFLLFDLSFIIIWGLVNYRRAWIPLAGLVPCIGFILDYCPFNLHGEVPQECIKVLTYNTNNYGNMEEDKEEGKRITTEYIKNSDADIICLQESGGKGVVVEAFLEYMDSIGYVHDEHHGNILLSRFPILEMDTFTYATHLEKGIAGNSSKWYKVQCGKDTIIVVNNHLESNRLKPEIKDEYVANFDDPEYESIKKSGHTIGSRLTASNAYRAPQADSLVAFVNRNPGQHIIMCGDYNDTPISYTYQRIKSCLTNAFRQSGRGIGISYNQRGFWVRIDHIFVSDNCKTYNTTIDNSIKSSDHYPLISWVKIQ